MKRLNRSYTPEFRAAAVQQVVDGGRSIPAVARSLEMSVKTLANWVFRSRKGELLARVSARPPVSELEAEVSRLRQEVSRLRQEVAKLRLEKEILKNRSSRPGAPRMNRNTQRVDCDGAWTEAACFLEVSSPSKNLAQGKLRTELWRHLA